MDLSLAAGLCRGLARDAGAAILEFYQGPWVVKAKDDGSPLTLADEAAHRVILAGLIAVFPEVPVLSEEAPDDGSRRKSPWCFIVDPLDGTKEFLSRNGEFTVNIALVQEGVPVLGVVYAPAIDDLYWAWQGGGAWRQVAGQGPEAIAVSPPHHPPRLTVSRSHRSPQEDQYIADHGVTEVLPMGSSLKGCLVARGAADLYLRAGTVMEWDIAAMQAVVQEAGGRVVQWSNPDEVVRYNQGDSLKVNGFVCSACGKL